MTDHTDRTTDPGVLAALLLARRGTAYFRQQLDELPADALTGPSLLPGWSRAHVIAHVGYNAVALGRLVEWARTGIEQPMYLSTEARNAEIETGSTLNATALRDLVERSAVELDTAWRELPTAAWNHRVQTAQGRIVPAAETAWMRSREVFLHAIDLDHGARFEDLDDAFLHRLLVEISDKWAAPDGPTAPEMRLVPTDGTAPVGPPSDAMMVTGRLADLVGWATGRGTAGDDHRRQPGTGRTAVALNVALTWRPSPQIPPIRPLLIGSHTAPGRSAARSSGAVHRWFMGRVDQGRRRPTTAEFTVYGQVI